MVKRYIRLIGEFYILDDSLIPRSRVVESPLGCNNRRYQ